MGTSSSELIEKVERSIAMRKTITILVMLAIFVVSTALIITVSYPSWLPQKPADWLLLYAITVGAMVVHAPAERNEKRLLARLKEIEDAASASLT